MDDILAIQNDYYALKPDVVIDAVESLGLFSDARIIILNSYENRVYQVGIDDATPIIVKFYRPARWTDEQILEEHELTLKLAEYEIPVVPPMVFSGRTLHYYNGYRFAVYARRGGRAPELCDPDHLLMLGHCLGKIHAISVNQPYRFRPAINCQNYISAPSTYIVDHQFIPPELKDAYVDVIADLVAMIESILAATEYQTICLHGDCHVGNMLWTDQGVHFVDFDDSRMGPAIQDIWMLLSGSRDEQNRSLYDVLEGYTEFHDFNPAEIRLIEVFRTLRIVHYSGWLASRWSDPAFNQTFTWFNTANYWTEHLLQCRHQLSALQEEPLRWMQQ